MFVFIIHRLHDVAGNRQQGSGNALDLFLQRRAENIKKFRTAGNSSSFDNITSGRNGIDAHSLQFLAYWFLMAYNVSNNCHFLLSQPRIVLLY